MIRRENKDTPTREVKSWLEKYEIPLQRWMRLLPSEKKILHGLLSIPRRPTSDAQLRDLYAKLCLTDLAGREAVDPANFMPSVELDRFFTPVQETLSYLEKFERN